MELPHVYSFNKPFLSSPELRAWRPWGWEWNIWDTQVPHDNMVQCMALAAQIQHLLLCGDLPGLASPLQHRQAPSGPCTLSWEGPALAPLSS